MLFAVGHVAWFVVALVVGVLVAASCVVALKSMTERAGERAIEQLAETAA